MKEYEFKIWLKENSVFTTPKQVSDCVARAKRVEKNFIEVFGNDFDLDKEFDKDELAGVRKALSVYGQKHMQEFIPDGTKTSFQIGNRSMGALSNAILKYIRFKKSLQQ